MDKGLFVNRWGQFVLFVDVKSVARYYISRSTCKFIIPIIVINLQLHFVHTKQIIPHDLIFSWDSAAFAADADVDEDEHEEDYEDEEEEED